MSIYIVKDNEKKKVNISATDVQLLDIDGKFKNKNLEDAMKEIGSGTEQNMTRIEEKVANLEDNVIGSELMGTIATTLRGAIAEHENDITTLLKNGVVTKSIPSAFDTTKISTWTENGIYLTASSGIIDLPQGWSQGRHTVVVFSTGNDNYSFQLITPYAGTVTANKKIAFRSNLIEGSEWKELADGTDSGWADLTYVDSTYTHYTTYWKSQIRKQGNKVTVILCMQKTDKTEFVANSNIVIANVPSAYKPSQNVLFTANGEKGSAGVVVVSGSVGTNQQLKVTPSAPCKQINAIFSYCV